MQNPYFHVIFFSLSDDQSKVVLSEKDYLCILKKKPGKMFIKQEGDHGVTIFELK